MMSAIKSRPTISPRPLIGVAKRQLDWQPGIFGKSLSPLVSFCQNFLFFDAQNALKFYFYIVLLGSLAASVIDLPRDYYFVGKRNFFNMYFVKWSWAWTLVLLAPFLLISSFVYSARSYHNVLRQLLRLTVATLIWFLCVQVFAYFERAGCSIGGPAYVTESECRTKKGRWRSFEISGHVFILTYIALVTAEELSIFSAWLEMGKRLQRPNYLTINSVDENDLSSNQINDSLVIGSTSTPILRTPYGVVQQSPLLKSSPKSSPAKIIQEKFDIDVLYRRYDWLVALFYVLNVLFSIFWTFMVFVTSLYYHEFEQKVAAFIIAYLCWYVTYRIWYPALYPGPPGYGKIKI